MNKSNVEIERRYLISNNVFNFFKTNYPMYQQDIEQYYAKNSRYRRIQNDAQCIYFKTAKFNLSDDSDRTVVVRNEYEYVITKSEWKDNYNENTIIYKSRYGVKTDFGFIEIDEFKNKNDCIILEIEFDSIDERNEFSLSDVIPVELGNEFFEIGTYLSNKKLANSDCLTELIKLLNIVNTADNIIREENQTNEQSK